MKNKIHFVLLAAGAVLLAIGVFFFGRICAVKDSIYADYNLSFSDASFQQVFINDHDEATVKADLTPPYWPPPKAARRRRKKRALKRPPRKRPPRARKRRRPPSRQRRRRWKPSPRRRPTTP